MSNNAQGTSSQETSEPTFEPFFTRASSANLASTKDIEESLMKIYPLPDGKAYLALQELSEGDIYWVYLVDAGIKFENTSGTTITTANKEVHVIPTQDQFGPIFGGYEETKGDKQLLKMSFPHRRSENLR